MRSRRFQCGFDRVNLHRPTGSKKRKPSPPSPPPPSEETGSGEEATGKTAAAAVGSGETARSEAAWEAAWESNCAGEAVAVAEGACLLLAQEAELRSSLLTQAVTKRFSPEVASVGWLTSRMRTAAAAVRVAAARRRRRSGAAGAHRREVMLEALVA
jgi:hypothetical protein